jgi:hypothetical protein
MESAYNRRRILIILARQYRLAMGWINTKKTIFIPPLFYIE